MTDDDFDVSAFCDWLETRETPITEQTLRDEWPSFPWGQMATGITMQYDPETGESSYFKRDLRRAAKGLPNGD